MFRLEHTWVLWGLLLIPLMMVGFYVLNKWRKNARNKFAETKLFQNLMPAYSNTKYRLKFTFFGLAFGFLLIALANPQIGTKLEEAKRDGIDLMIAVDVSNSMNATDLSPSRLERAKRAMQQLLTKLKGDRLGIIVFAGEAYTQLPITTDYSAAKLFLNTINTDIVPTQGTNIAAAIDLASNSFDYNSGGSKALIIVSDGEDHEDNAVDAAKAAAEKGIKIFTIGMGTPTGAPIPLYKNGKQDGFRQDKQGNTIITSLNEDMMRELADVGKGLYIRATNASVGFQQILDELNGMNKKEYASSVYTDYEDRFQIFLAFSFLFLLISLILNEKKSKWRKKIKLFES